MIDLTIQNPAQPELTHVMMFRDLNNAMSAVMSIYRMWDNQGMSNRERPLVHIGTELGVLMLMPNGGWLKCKENHDGRWLPDGRSFSWSDLCLERPVARTDLDIELPTWVYTWAAEVGL